MNDDPEKSYVFVNPANELSDHDFNTYLECISTALNVHRNREAIRHGLWKRYPAADQASAIHIKIDRVLHTLRQPEPTAEQLDNCLEEFYDIINYAVFGIRKVKGSD
jgi:hypothetical protein